MKFPSIAALAAAMSIPRDVIHHDRREGKVRIATPEEKAAREAKRKKRNMQKKSRKNNRR